MPADTTGTSETINSQLAVLNVRADAPESDYPYVIFRVFENKFAVSCKYVVSIEQIAETTEIVNSSHGFRGISYYKNEPISVFCLRELFGLMSRQEYIKDVINLPRHIEAHENYAKALEDCIVAGTRFELNVDPHKCAFGKWFYENRTKIGADMRGGLDQIESYHGKFHQAAETVKDLLEMEKTSEAADYLDEIMNIKAEIVKRLGDLNEALLKNANGKEQNLILQLRDKKVGLIIDAADTVEEIHEIQALPPSVVMTNYIKRLGLGKKDRNIIFILEAEEFGSYGNQ